MSSVASINDIDGAIPLEPIDNEQREISYGEIMKYY
jgi:hypothetical protein